jgi:tripartite-type tricarboxylate transporter receptor subunit TctC
MSSSERSKFLPDVPTLVESGYDLVITAWHAILVPAKTPRDIVDRLNAYLNAALIDPDVRARLGVLGSVAAPGTPASFDLQLRRDFERFRDVVKTANIAID